MKSEYRKQLKEKLSVVGFYEGAIEALAMTMADFGKRFPGEMIESPNEIFTNVYGTLMFVNDCHPKFGNVVEIYDLFDEDGKYCCFIPTDNFQLVLEAILDNKQLPELIKLKYNADDRTKYFESMENWI